MRLHPSILTVILLFPVHLCLGQNHQQYATGEILQKLEQLNTLGSVLYVAAHPDDENTQLISFLANGKHYRTGYLSATRGDGGQNLIGPEIREALGVIRTQELLAARRIDGGHQFFSRANDFGYSKDPQETFNMWDKEKVLADFVWVIRKFRPDVIVTRFNQKPKVTHGHHTASAILAMEAFKISGDSTVFPEQLRYVDPWSPKKIFWNTSHWFFRRSGEEFDPDKYLKVDVGGFNSYLGQSYTEIAAASRSMHKSQGFGVMSSRGAEFEYFEQWAGEKSTETLFDGLNTSWSRVEDSEQVAYNLREARLNFDPDKPEDILPYLLSARKALLKLPDQYWKEVKIRQLENSIAAVTGLFTEVIANDHSYTANDSIKLNLEIVNRSEADITLVEVRHSVDNHPINYDLKLAYNQKNELSSAYQLPAEMDYSHPYWLKHPNGQGMYTVDAQQLIGLPENPEPFTSWVTVEIDGQFIEYELPVQYKYQDPVEGEVYRPLVVQPRVMVNLEEKALIFANGASKEIPVRVIAGADSITGTVSLEIPDGWASVPEVYEFELMSKGEEAVFMFDIVPPSRASEVEIRAVVECGDEKFDRGRTVIDYPHFPVQTLFPQAKTRAVKIELEKRGKNIAYIMGAGDEVPDALEQVGYEVTLLDKDQVESAYLNRFDAVILGVRAFNTVPWLAFKNTALFEYVANGGNLIVQYNTSHRLVTEDVAPYPLKLSRDRVTVEEAPIEVLEPSHPILNTPNQINDSDFKGWVQERGLYFPNEWSDEFIPIFSAHDPGEDPSRGSMLVAKYGEGYYMYTGLSFFRELPAGVSGAYRLLVNMISMGEEEPK